MRPLLIIGAAVAFIGSFLLIRIVLHGYTDHGHTDVLHLGVAVAVAAAGIVLLRRALSRPVA